ncbi:alpha-2-macroglobulin family protein [Ottowia sp. SB7-C50]|uniref:alpha-2-macroglobulin family protein n=1 Tax=Ottowia sp. SB7-C50 TaxID=3081231 RepID=UPI002954268C|nr:MG2 domain-containing protein [Ottowia sp. SB7-C50]WOP14525.1 MG2 domain-containing protein [Ottowia sp. SB7-C50]
MPLAFSGVRHALRCPAQPLRLSALAGLLLATPLAHAFTVTTFSPQGEVSRVRQVTAQFSEAMVAFGDAKAPTPFKLSCDNAAASRGQGRWTSAREWVYDFEADLPPGVRCRADAVPGFRSTSGGTWAGPTSHAFQTGGPFVQRIVPAPSEAIEEEQAFAIRLNGDATPESLAAQLWCAVDGLGERVPVRPLAADARAALFKHLGWDKDAERAPLRHAAFQCNRRLTAGSRLQVVYGAGVVTPSGVANRVERRFAYQVREPFSASFSCERENAQAACMPIRPLELRFSAPVPRRLAALVRLRSDRVEHEPIIDAGTDADALVEHVQFPHPLPERSSFTLTLPPDLKDASGRPPVNATSFPMRVATGPMPPLAKFAAAPFGIVERFAEGPGGPALLPLTLRYVEPSLQTRALPVSHLQPQGDAEIIAWFTRVQRYDQALLPRAWAAKDLKRALPPPVNDDTKDMVESRTLSLLQGRTDVKTIDVPPPPSQGGGGAERPFEVVGLPLAPGFHVLELNSPRLGQALLNPKYGAERAMVVRTSALVTNLGVHFKLGRGDALAWVTTLDNGRPVEGARVQVSDCHGKPLAQASTDAQGIARFKGLSPEPPRCSQGEDFYADFQQAYFVSARADSRGSPDMAFTWSSWQRGIEPWRFNVPTSSDPQPDLRAHSVLDRVLLRAGETVSMKHLLRTETPGGFGLPAANPATLVITHVGSGQEFTQPLAWRATATGGRSADSSFAVPAAAKLGVYQVSMRLPRRAGATGAEEGGETVQTGQFRVEEFRLPVYQGSIAPQSKDPLVATASVPLQLQVGYVSGGPAAGLPVRVSALTRARVPRFDEYAEFTFEPPRARGTTQTDGDGEEEAAARQDQRVVADKLPVTLDRQGQGQVTVPDLPAATRPRDLVLEATYADPNGELQTLRGNTTLWPAAVIAGVRAEGWVSASQSMQLQALALDLNGKPQAGVPLDVKAIARITTTSRKRMVGGFYTYDNRTETKDLGTVCTGTSDARGLLVCNAKLSQPGEVELVVSARDAQGRVAQAATSVWVTRQGELWFGGDNHDRMDVLPEKKQYAVGDTVRLQVRMPFRRATALVAVEREGIVETQVVELRGDDPTVSLKVGADWSPNVYISVLALRGRLIDVPWYSFFTWGYQRPREWWDAFWNDRKEYVAPTAMVDLSKPAFRLGMAEIRVGTEAHRIDIAVKPDKDSYPVRATAHVTIEAKLPDGQPAAHAEVAVAAVDEALLELMPNRSWDVLDAMLQRRAWGVQTATAQMEIVGRRHYGRKAVPAGGDGGGGAPTRELLDTLLLWNPRVVLDAQGRASIDVPLNDALTRFRVVAIGDSGTGLFGTGRASLRATQDLQIISGLPPLVRGGDAFRALLTVRNTTAQPMKVQLTPRATLLTLKPQTADVPAGEARELAWDVTVPPELAALRSEQILWEIEARDETRGARDALKVSQRVLPAVPVTVQQATLVQLDGPLTQDVAAPTGALAGRGGVRLTLLPRLADGLPGVRDWFARYPYSCLEQKASIAIGLRDEKLWQQTAAQLPAYLDGDGLAYYFPPRAGTEDRGSDILTAALLSSTHEAARLNPAFALPDSVRARMIAGLTAFVEGRIERKFWSPRSDLDVRKIAALEALSRHGAARAAMLGSITVAPHQWPTSAVIDWINVLKRVPGVADQRTRLHEADQVLRARLSYQGTRLAFSTEREDHWWWLMAGGDVNSARLLLAVLDDPAWKDDLPRIANGFIARQQGGAWNTTAANLWGSLALQAFAQARESAAVSGTTRATLGDAKEQIHWSQVARAKPADPQGAASAGPRLGAPSQYVNNTLLLPWPPAKAPLTVTHEGSGKPWLTLQSLAAVPLTAPFAAGYQIRKTITPVEQADKTLPAGQYSRGDVLRVSLEVTAASDMTWVAITDPVPGGATILGSGLGRDSEIAPQNERRDGSGWPAYEERSFEAFRSYYEYLPKGTVTVQYTVRLNNPGTFQLPPSRVEALYAPEMHGEAPNARVQVR